MKVRVDAWPLPSLFWHPYSHVPLLPLQAAHRTTTSPHFCPPVRFAIHNSKFAPLRLQWRVRVEGSSQTHSVPSTHSARTAPSLPQKRADKPRACAAFPKRSPISDARVRVCVEFRLELVWGRPPRLGLPVRPVSCVSSMPSCCVGAATHSPHIPPALPVAVVMRWCTRNAKFWP